MQSEGGASGAVHGSLSAGALTTTFTASQGLMLMLPNMHKIAGEMLPTVFLVSARSLACQSLSIFGDHSDVMAARNTGFALTCAGSVQEAQDLAIVAHLATLRTQDPLPPLLRRLPDLERRREGRPRLLRDPGRAVRAPVPGGLPQALPQPRAADDEGRPAEPRRLLPGPRDRSTSTTPSAPALVQHYMDKVAKAIGRQYHLFDYFGAPDAEKVIVMMGSGAETAEETINYLNARGAKLGLVKVRLYRPFDAAALAAALPRRPRRSPSSTGPRSPARSASRSTSTSSWPWPAAASRSSAAATACPPRSSRRPWSRPSTTTSTARPRHGFTVGINDDVTHTSIPVGPVLDTELPGTVRCKFWGYGSDGTVGANKNSIKIIADNTEMYGQGYFQYDSKKSGGVTISHLRFGKKPHPVPVLPQHGRLRRPAQALLHRPAGHPRRHPRGRHLPDQLQLEGRRGLREPDRGHAEDDHRQEGQGLHHRRPQDRRRARPGPAHQLDHAGLLLQALGRPARGRGHRPDQEGHREDLRPQGPGRRQDELGRRRPGRLRPGGGARPGQDHQVRPGHQDRPRRRQRLRQGRHRPGHPVQGRPACRSPRCPSTGPSPRPRPASRSAASPSSARSGSPRTASSATSAPSSAPTPPSGPSRSPRPTWPARPTASPPSSPTPRTTADLQYRVQVYIEDCVGCGSCAEVCPAKTKALVMTPIAELRAAGEADKAEFFDKLPDNVLDGIKPDTLKGSQFLRPLFEFSGACAGCGETPYVKLATQLFGDRMIIANATGCSSIYGGTFPTSPYCVNAEGQGPGLGQLAVRGQRRIRLRHAAGGRRQPAPAGRLDRRGPGGRDDARADRRPGQDEGGLDERRRGSQGGGQGRPGRPARGPGQGQRRPSPTWPRSTSSRISWSRRASGASAATAGPTTSATAASTTSWP